MAAATARAVAVVLLDVLSGTAPLLAETEDCENAVKRGFGAAEEAEKREQENTSQHADDNAGNGTPAETTATAALASRDGSSGARGNGRLEWDGGSRTGSSRCGYTGRVGHAGGSALSAELAVLVGGAADTAAARFALIPVACYGGSGRLDGHGRAAASAIPAAVDLGFGDCVGFSPRARPVLPITSTCNSRGSAALRLVIGVRVACFAGFAAELAGPTTHGSCAGALHESDVVDLLDGNLVKVVVRGLDGVGVGPLRGQR